MSIVPAKLYLSIKIYWPKPDRADKCEEEKRSLDNFIRFQLITIHPNPGPGRNKTEEGKKRRREGRYQRRKEKREAKLRREERREGKKKKIYSIVTWNVQRMSLRDYHKRKAKIVAEYVRKQNWDAVLLSELKADRPGVVWLGEGDIAIIHSERAGIMLRGELLEGWNKEGKRKKISERSVSVKVKGLALTATYLPVWIGTNDEEIETTKDILAEHVKWAKKEEIGIVGGDFNAHIGRDEETTGVCGKYGLRGSNEKGRQLVQWCEENNMSYVNSFYNHKKRGTWFNRMLGRWYELDGFLMNKDQRHRHARKISTVGEMTISDHKPKKLLIEMKKWHWKTEERKRVPKIRWERLKDPETARLFKFKVEEITENRVEDADNTIEEVTGWEEIVSTSIAAAKEICGEQEKRVENPWMVGKDVRLQELKSRISGAVSRRNQIRELHADGPDLDRARDELKEARREMKGQLRDWEKQWWEEIISKCKEAGERGDSGTVYKTLKDLGKRDWKGSVQTTNITTAEFKDHFESVSKERFENSPEEIDEAVREVEDISETDLAREWRPMLDEVPSQEEILKEMSKMRESAPGEDGVRLIYMTKGGEMMTQKVVEMVQFMWMNGSDKWEEGLRTGLVIPLHKKGDRDNPNQYRGVVLLSMGSRIVARIMASRIRLWSEALGLMDDDQSGFRKGRSTADVTQVMVRLQEDTNDLKRRLEKEGREIPEGEEPVARLLDLRKAYPRVNRPALWGILRRYGIGERALRILQDLHESTLYKVRGNDGVSEAWVPARGLREGCPSSPILFNIFHQVVMRLGAKARKRKAIELDLEVGIAINWVPGSFFPGESLAEKHNSESKRRRIDKELFADDTQLIGSKKEMTSGLKAVKDQMSRFEERNNDDKEEELIFGTDESNEIRILGSYLGPAEDVRQRLKRAGAAWVKIKSRLKGSKLSKNTQARVVEACVESTALFDSQARTWQVREVKKLQSSLDKIYRYIWSRKIKPPLIQMQEDSKNMQDVRNELGVKSVRVKIEKRCLERIGHIMRMDDTRMVKAVTLGWMEELENVPKMPGKKRKTLIYWKKLLREGGIDKTRIGKLTSNRKEWKKIVRERTKHLEKWERRGGKRNQEERGERNQLREIEVSFKCDECEENCTSKAGLVNHIKRMHEISSQKVTFKCNTCNKVFQYQSNLVNHSRICEGITVDPEKRKCLTCSKEYHYKNFARHKKKCGVDREVAAAPRELLGERGPCSWCNLIITKKNMSRHKKHACQNRREVEL